MHPFCQADIKEQIDELEKLEEQMRRTTRGRSFRSVNPSSEYTPKGALGEGNKQACCNIY